MSYLKKSFIFLFLLFLSCSCYPASSNSIMDGSPKKTYESMLYPSFLIINPKDNSSGSGVIFYSNKGVTLGLTCAHVLDSFYPVGFFYDTRDVRKYSAIALHVVDYSLQYDLSVVELLSDEPMFTASMYKTTKEFRENVFIFEKIIGVGSGLKDRPSPTIGIWSYFESPKKAFFAGASISIAPGDSGGGLFEADTMKLIGLMRAISVYKGHPVYHKSSIIPYNTIRKYLTHSPSIKIQKAIKDLGWKKED